VRCGQAPAMLETRVYWLPLAPNKAVVKVKPTTFDRVVSGRGCVLTMTGLETRILSG
jgi:hypothetical protein